MRQFRRLLKGKWVQRFPCLLLAGWVGLPIEVQACIVCQTADFDLILPPVQYRFLFAAVWFLMISGTVAKAGIPILLVPTLIPATVTLMSLAVLAMAGYLPLTLLFLFFSSVIYSVF